MTAPPLDHMGLALASVSILEGALTHSDEETAALMPDTLEEAKVMISASTFIAYELAGELADQINGDTGAEPQLGTQEFAEMYARRDATRQKLIEIMRQYVADKFRGESK